MNHSSSRCAVCGHDNPSANRFCGSCGARLPELCNRCGTPAREDDRFCGACGAQLSDVPSLPDSALEVQSPQIDYFSTDAGGRGEERRLVTALFCDLVGFTPLSETLDIEDVREIQSDYFGHMTGIVERYGGTVEKYAGDAVLAIFGAPVAQENDAERAVLCALDMHTEFQPIATSVRASWDIDAAIRIGVNTGDAVSGSWEHSALQDKVITGDAVNTAARLQTEASPGEILVGAETARLTRRRIRYGPHRLLTLKGKVASVIAYPALEVRDILGERWENGEFRTPLVGREREMVELSQLWLRAQARDGQLATIMGDVGVGKSRLVTEFVASVERNTGTRVVRARCLSYTQNIGLSLIDSLLRSLLGIHQGDSGLELEQRVSDGVGSLMSRHPGSVQAEAIDVFREALMAPSSESAVTHAGAEIRRQVLIRSLRLAVAALCETDPVVVVLEDMHWIDSSSEQVLREVVNDIPSLRLLALATQRPGWRTPWDELSWPERMTLRPLKEKDAGVLAGAVLGGARLSVELERYVSERAGGNPFFVEELLLALRESSAVEDREGHVYLVNDLAQRLPSTLTEILLARLDRLERPAKHLAQVGSVIGRTFGVRLLAQVVRRDQKDLEMPLAELQEAEIAFPKGSPDVEYVFKHATMRDAAYNTLVQRSRRDLHLQTARALSALFPSDEYAEVIAYHYARTKEDTEAAPWIEKAGDRAAAIYSNETAIDHYRKAMRRLGPGNMHARARLEEKLGRVLYTAGQYHAAIPEFELSIATYRDLNDLQSAGRVTAMLGSSHRRQGTAEEGIARVQDMLGLLGGAGPSPAVVSLDIALAELLFLGGRYEEQLRVASEAAETARRIDEPGMAGEAEMARGTALICLGESEEAFHVLESALPLIESSRNLMKLYVALNNLAAAAYNAGRSVRYRSYLERALTVAEQIGNPNNLAFVLGNLGIAYGTAGDWPTAREYVERGMEYAQSTGQSADVANPLRSLGQLCLWEGDWDSASRYLHEALSLAESAGDRSQSEGAQYDLAQLDLLQGDPKSALARLDPFVKDLDHAADYLLPNLAWAYAMLGDDNHIERGLEIAALAVKRGRRQPGFLMDALLILGIVLMTGGRKDEARTALEEGLELARAWPYPYLQARILEQLALLDDPKEQSAQARLCLDEAAAIFSRLGAGRDQARVEARVAKLTPRL